MSLWFAPPLSRVAVRSGGGVRGQGWAVFKEMVHSGLLYRFGQRNERASSKGYVQIGTRRWEGCERATLKGSCYLEGVA